MISKVSMKWTAEGWEVSFGKNIIMVTSSYKNAFFWVKYQDEIHADFVLDYIHNR